MIDIVSEKERDTGRQTESTDRLVSLSDVTIPCADARVPYAGGKLPSATLGNPLVLWLFALSPAAAVARQLLRSWTIDSLETVRFPVTGADTSRSMGLYPEARALVRRASTAGSDPSSEVDEVIVGTDAK